MLSSSIIDGLFKPLAFLFLYVVIAWQIVQLSFSLIYTIANEWARWLGGHVKSFGNEEQAEAKIGGAAQQGAAKAGEVAGSLPQKGAEAGKAAKDVGVAIGSAAGGGGDMGAEGGGGGGGGSGGTPGSGSSASGGASTGGGAPVG